MHMISKIPSLKHNGKTAVTNQEKLNTYLTLYPLIQYILKTHSDDNRNFTINTEQISNSFSRSSGSVHTAH